MREELLFLSTSCEVKRMEERRGFRGRGGGFIPKPVEIGKEYEVDVQESSRRGEGIARIQSLVIFIPNAKPSEHVKIRITRISRRFAEAEIVGKSKAESETEGTE
jgi:predicted RNA-binding protein with TRAM domain